MPINPKSMFYNISVLSLSGVALQALGFVYQVVLSRLAGAQALGVYQLVSPVYAVVAAATLSGVRMAMTSLSAGLSPKTQMPRIRALVRSAVRTFLLLFGLFGVPVIVCHDFVAERIIGEARTSTAIVLMLVCVFLTGFEGIFESLFLGIGKTAYTAVSNLLEQGVKIVIILLMLALWGRAGDSARTAALIALGMALSEVPVILWLLTVYRRESRRGGGRRESGAPAAPLLRVAAPVSVSAVVTNLLSSAGVVLLPGRLAAAGMTQEQAVSALGVVSGMALPLLMLPMVLIRSISNVLLPNISMSLSGGNRADIARKVRKSFQATGLIVLPATAILVPLSVPLARLLYRQELSLAYVLLLAVAAVISYYELIASSILNGLGRQRAGMACMILGEVVQLGCTYFLAAMPSLQIYGYLIGMIVGPAAVLLGSLWLIRRYAGCSPLFTESFLIPLLASGVAGGFTRYFYVTAAGGGEIGHIAVSAALGAGVCGGVFLLCGLRPLRYLRTLMVQRP